MRHKKKNKRVFIIVLLLIFITIGYASLTTTLNINGFTSIKGNSWDVHFENVQITDGSAEAIIVPTSNNVNTTEIKYKVVLNEPGDFYEFTVDAVNKGTIDAMIGNEPTIQIENNDLDNILIHSITYSNGMPIMKGNSLRAMTGKVKYKVRLEYNEDITKEQLIDTAKEINLSFSSTYVQKEEKEILTTFQTDSWKTIIDNVQNKNKTYKVGLTKEVNLGEYGIHEIRVANNTTPEECDGEYFSQTACGFVLEFSDTITKHVMNEEDTNVGGWPATSMRKFLNNKNDSTSIINSLDSIIDTNKILNTYVISSSGSYAGEENFKSNDKLYLLASHEIWENVDNSSNTLNLFDSAFYNTRQLDFYKEYLNEDGTKGVTVANYSGAIKTGFTTEWWLRTSMLNYDNRFIFVYYDGKGPATLAANKVGVSPAFRLA